MKYEILAIVAVTASSANSCSFTYAGAGKEPWPMPDDPCMRGERASSPHGEKKV